jgi:hypothetical protein
VCRGNRTWKSEEGRAKMDAHRVNRHRRSPIWLESGLNRCLFWQRGRSSSTCMVFSNTAHARPSSYTLKGSYLNHAQTHRNLSNLFNMHFDRLASPGKPRCEPSQSGASWHPLNSVFSHMHNLQRFSSLYSPSENHCDFSDHVFFVIFFQSVFQKA